MLTKFENICYNTLYPDPKYLMVAIDLELDVLQNWLFTLVITISVAIIVNVAVVLGLLDSLF